MKSLSRRTVVSVDVSPAFLRGAEFDLFAEVVRDVIVETIPGIRRVIIGLVGSDLAPGWLCDVTVETDGVRRADDEDAIAAIAAGARAGLLSN